MSRWTGVGGAGVLVAAGILGSPLAGQEWRQGVEYRIEARLNEASSTLEGAARVRYRNNSPRTLHEFYFHLYLNAFRPNSAWATRDLEYGIRTFQDLGPGEHGFERIRSLTVDGLAVSLFYPFAPDSTVVGFRLPEPLEPGESLAVDLRWDARPSSVPRRQGRAGRQYDFAQWYPRVVVYDAQGWRTHPLYRAGEFYGEFATYDVTLQLRSDQVVGATGVPVSGDPGWETAAVSGTGPVDHQREWYGSSSGPPCVQRGRERICGAYPARTLQREEVLGHLPVEAPAGWKRVRWYAEDVHHFAWSTSPDYTFEQGSWNDVAIRVLYRPGDEESWGRGIAVRRTAVALQWLDSIFGEYPYPQVTNLHRIEGGGTEFPMLVMDGSASQGLILHEVGHIYAHGILANNEWYEGWLDEGMSTFQTTWFSEVNGAGSEVWSGARRRVLEMDVRGSSEPVVLNGESYSEQGVYSAMIYTKGSLVLWMLREMVGEETMVRILRSYFDRYRFRHVSSSAFQEVAEEVSGRDLDWFFGQWLHTTGTVDYALDGVKVFPSASGAWTRFELRRLGELRMPVPVRLQGAGQAKDTVIQGMDLDRRVEIWTPFRPERVVLDPDGTILDWNPTNGEWTRSWFDRHGSDVYLDNPLRAPRVALDQVPMGVSPLVWANAGGWVLGYQTRTSLLGFSNSLTRVGFPGFALGDKGKDPGFDREGSLYWRTENPLGRRRAVLGSTSELFWGEGRFAVRSVRETDLRRHPLTGRTRAVRAFLAVAGVYEDGYLPAGRWSPGDRWLAEFGVGGRVAFGLGSLAVELDATSGAGFDTQDRRYLRGTLAIDAVAPLGRGWALAARVFGGAVGGLDPTGGVDGLRAEWAPRDRMFSLGSGDPLQQLGNPLVRSRGALEETGRTSGGGTLPGFNTALPYPLMATLAIEVGSPEWRPSFVGVLAFRPLVFAGIGWGELPPDLADTEPLPLELGEDEWVKSAGVGLEMGIAGSPVRLRVDLPVWVSEPALASSARNERVAPRVQLTFDPPRWAR